MHFHPAFPLVEERSVLETGEIEAAAELAIDARKQIEVESRSDTERIGVCRFQDLFRLLEISAEEEAATDAADVAQKRRRRRRIVVADARSEKEHRGVRMG